MGNIKNSWSLSDFREKFEGKVKRAKFTNSNTGSEFSMLAFPKGGDAYCFVGFSSELGEISSKEIKENLTSLQVVELEVSEEVLEGRKKAGVQLESYKLCKKGENFQEWEEIDI